MKRNTCIDPCRYLWIPTAATVAMATPPRSRRGALFREQVCFSWRKFEIFWREKVFVYLKRKMTSEVMSNEDFRAHLYRSLQERGILNSLKVCSLHAGVDVQQFYCLFCSLS